MKKPLLWVAGGVALLVIAFYAFNAYIYDEKQGDGAPVVENGAEDSRLAGDFEFTGLIGGGWTWQRTRLPGGEIMEAPAGGQFVLTLDEDGLVYSTTDCNHLSGTYAKNEEVLSFGPMAMTKMYCEGSQEGAYAAQLAQTGSFAIEGDTLTLILLKDAGVMEFTR